MVYNWSKKSLGMLCEKIGSGVTPRGGASVYIQSGCALIRSQNVYDLRFDLDGLVYINKETAKRMNGVEVLPNDILLNITGDSVARCCMVPLDVIPARVNQHVSIIRPNQKLLDSKFLLYWFNMNTTKSQLLSFAGAGATRKALTKSMIESMEIEFPEVSKQISISSFLSSLDDKIELNNKINKNLEELAQTLYKRWFVDFEFSNEDGETYQSSGGEMVESELGQIPKGWQIITLNNIVVKNKSKILPNNNLKLIDMANMPSYSIALNAFGIGDKLSTNTYVMDKYSFLYGSIRPYLGKFGIAPFDGITTGTIHNFRVQSDIDYSYVASTIFSTKFNDFCIKLSHGTKMPTIKWDDFISYKMAYSSDISFKFNNIVRAFYDQIVNNVLENIKLAQLRDELLPKLMNGQIEVPIEG